MRRALIWSLASVVLLTAGLSAAAETDAPSADEEEQEAPPRPPPCFDVAVVAKLTKQTPRPIPDDGFLYESWAWTLQAEVQQTLTGPRPPSRIEVLSSQHTGLRAEPYILLFLRSDRGGYVRVGSNPWIVKDAEGRFVMPLAGPYRDDDLARGFLPSDYLKRIRPIRYRAEDAWWLERSRWDTLFILDPTQEPDPDPLVGGPGWDTEVIDWSAYPWGKIEGDMIVADRGILLTELVQGLAERRCKR